VTLSPVLTIPINMLEIFLFSVWVIIVVWSIGNILFIFAKPNRYNFIDKFWVGVGIVVAFFQLWSLFKPINSNVKPVVVILVTINIIFLLFSNRKALQGKLKTLLSSLFDFIKDPYVLLFLYISSTTIFSASAIVNWFDTYLYHFNAVRWIYEYPAIPGLVHIHSRFGLNSSFFIFSAFVEAITRKGTSAHIALTAIVLVLVGQWLFTLRSKTSPFRQKVFCLLTLAPVLNMVWRDDQFPSLSTDFAVSIIILVAIYYLLSEKKEKIILTIVLSALALTIKISALFIFPLVLILSIDYLRKKKVSIRNVALAFVIAGIIITGFISRDTVLTGWLVYPTPVNFGKLDVEWAATWEQNSALRRDATGWARLPKAGYKETVNQGFLAWFSPWYGRNQNSTEFRLVFIGLVLFMSVWVLNNRKINKQTLVYWILFIATLASLLLWFVAAPSVRFGSVYFLLLFYLLSFPYFLQFKKELSRKALFTIFLIYTMLIAGVVPIVREYPFRFIRAKAGDSFPVEIRIVSEVNSNKVLMWVPINDKRCGNSKLPCNPYMTSVVMRNPDDISKGFLLKI